MRIMKVLEEASSLDKVFSKDTEEAKTWSTEATALAVSKMVPLLLLGLG